MRRFLPCVLLPLLACGAPDSASIRVTWLGTQAGHLSVPGRATLCPESNVVELVGLRADSGLAIALYPASGLEPGDYPVFDPELISEVRPGAGVGLRWFDLVQVKGLEAADGLVTLDQVDREVVGSLAVRMRTVDATADTLRVSGSFRVPLDTAPEGCGAMSRRRPL